MSSSFAWIDHSEAHRRKMLDAIDLFREQGTRDELGLSVIRDGLANLLFPGTGALQTRARYFCFVPWMYQLFESERVRSSDVTRRGRAFEISLIDAVVASEDSAGAIGAEPEGNCNVCLHPSTGTGCAGCRSAHSKARRTTTIGHSTLTIGGSLDVSRRTMGSPWSRPSQLASEAPRGSGRIRGPRKFEEGEGAGAPESGA